MGEWCTFLAKMPEMDGCKICRRLKADPSLFGQIEARRTGRKLSTGIGRAFFKAKGGRIALESPSPAPPAPAVPAARSGSSCRIVATSFLGID